jgi:glycosyltransferase involved in cell wall biosynthesis
LNFTVLIATYNAGKTLRACLESVISQKGVTLEILVADGESSDDTLEIIRAYDDRLAYWTSSPDQGVYDAWNKIIPMVRGTWVLFLGADDILPGPDTLRSALDEIGKAGLPEAGFVYGQVELTEGEETIERLGEAAFHGGETRVNQEWPFSHTALLHHASLFQRFGVFDPSFKIAGDYDFVTRCLKEPSTPINRIDVLMARMAAGGLSTSAKSRVITYKEVEAARHKMTLEPLKPQWLERLQRRAGIAHFLERWVGSKGLLLVANGFRLVTGRKPRKRYS